MAFRRFKQLGQGNDLNLVLFEPRSDWRPPLTFPDLSDAKRIAVDLETRDPHLKEKGPGSIRRDGYPVGIAIASDTGFRGYFPFAHLGGGNMDRDRVLNFAHDLLKRPELEVAFANGPYDLEWLAFLGITVAGRIHDVQTAEPLLDEEREGGYALEKLAMSYLGEGKDERLLNEAAQVYGITKAERENPKAWLWKLHSKYVGPYAEVDAERTLRVLDLQLPILEAEGLRKIYDMECDLMKLVLKMRLRGVPVDLEKAAHYSKEFKRREDEIAMQVLTEHRIHLNPWSQPDIARICDKLKIVYPRTEKNTPSFTQDFLDANEHPFLKQVRELRRYDRMRGTFIDELIFGNQINGRIHCQFHQLRKDDSGTRSGRFSCTNPNLQQVPARDPDIGPIIRSLFIPEPGRKWAKLDYSQQEPRLLIHYAYVCKLRGADAARQAYIDDPNLDYYKYGSQVVGVPRRDTKTVILGRMYGMGKKKLAADLNRTIDEATKLLRKIDDSMPYVKELSDRTMRHVEREGKIRTYGGRLCHFDHWVPKEMQFDFGVVPVRGRERAESQWPEMELVRAFTHKSLNRLIQGSAGDMTKMAMLKNWHDFGDDGVPHLQVHDELDYSVDSEEHALKLQQGMQTCIKLEVPVAAELDYVEHWK